MDILRIFLVTNFVCWLQIALVSGAGAGIGEEICYQLNELGVILVCVDVDGEAARRTAAAINRGDRHSGVPKGTAFAFECDVSDKEQVGRVMQKEFRARAGTGSTLP